MSLCILLLVTKRIVSINQSDISCACPPLLPSLMLSKLPLMPSLFLLPKKCSTIAVTYQDCNTTTSFRNQPYAIPSYKSTNFLSWLVLQLSNQSPDCATHHEGGFAYRSLPRRRIDWRTNNWMWVQGAGVLFWGSLWSRIRLWRRLLWDAAPRTQFFGHILGWFQKVGENDVLYDDHQMTSS